MKHLIIIFFGLLISLTCSSQNKLANLDSTNYAELLLKIRNVNKKLVKRFSNQAFQELVNVIGSDCKILPDSNFHLIRDKEQLKKKNVEVVIYNLGMINYDNTSSYSYTLIVVLEKNIIQDIYVKSLHISWAR